MAISYTQSDLDNLKAALVSGAKVVSIGDRKIEYNSMAEIAALIAFIDSKINPPASPADTSCSPNLAKASFKKG